MGVLVPAAAAGVLLAVVLQPQPLEPLWLVGLGRVVVAVVDGQLGVWRHVVQRGHGHDGPQHRVDAVQDELAVGGEAVVDLVAERGVVAADGAKLGRQVDTKILSVLEQDEQTGYYRIFW